VKVRVGGCASSPPSGASNPAVSRTASPSSAVDLEGRARSGGFPATARVRKKRSGGFGASIVLVPLVCLYGSSGASPDAVCALNGVEATSLCGLSQCRNAEVVVC
jgi:hypothetical protein